MPDIVSAATRSRMMSGIRRSNTKPERIVRSALHARGFRFRLQSSIVPGHPDLVLPRYRAAVFVHGCFWHGHDCPLFRLPVTRRFFWEEKINRNRSRDRDVKQAVLAIGWRHLVIWECGLRGSAPGALDLLADRAAAWISSSAVECDLRRLGPSEQRTS